MIYMYVVSVDQIFVSFRLEIMRWNLVPSSVLKARIH